MNAYVGQTTRDTPTDRRLRLHRLGECTIRGQLPARRQPWIYDNGAYIDWQQGRPFDLEAWLLDVEAMREQPTQPDWCVAPDVVAGGASSLEFSLQHVGELRARGLTAYLAVQDGMVEFDVEKALALGDFAGVFVGGTLPWKLETGAAWVRLAHRLGYRCHIGRVGTAKRVRWAIECGADSIDSSLPLWSESKLRLFVDMLRMHPDQGLFWRNE